MSENATKTGHAIRVVAATVLLVPAFGSGVLVGRSLLDRRPPATEKRAETISDPGIWTDRRELAAYR